MEGLDKNPRSRYPLHVPPSAFQKTRREPKLNHGGNPDPQHGLGWPTAWTVIHFAAFQVCLDAFEVSMDFGHETSQALEVLRQRPHDRCLFLVTSFNIDRWIIIC
jgi:hypothetical protein